MKKVENTTSRHVTFCKRRAGLFKKAHELAVLCDAEVAIILFSSTGKISKFASSNMERTLRRFNMCLESRNLPTLEFKPEETEEQVIEEDDALRPDAQELKPKKWKLLGKDLTHLGRHELHVLEEQLTEGMMHVKDRKIQILMEQLEQSRKQEQQVSQKNQTLQRLVEELQGYFPSTSYPVPLSVRFPETEGIVRPTDSSYLPSTNFAAPLAICNGPETEHEAWPGNNPSTSSVAPLAVDSGRIMECNTEPSDLSDTLLALAPTWGWSK